MSGDTQKPPRPRHVTAGNYQEVYNYYGQRGPNRLVQASVHIGSYLLFHSDIHYEGNAKDHAANLLERGTRLIFASNHINVFDQLPSAALLAHAPYRRVIGRTLVLAKQPYFEEPIKIPYTNKRVLIRRPLEEVGGVPVWRDQEMGGMERSLRIKLTNTMIDTAAQRVADGFHIFGFPEGTRNRGDPTELQHIQGGMGRIAIAAAQKMPSDVSAPVALQPLSLFYGEGKLGLLHPVLVISDPIEVSRNDRPAQITRLLANAMQHGLAQAVSIGNTGHRLEEAA